MPHITKATSEHGGDDPTRPQQPIGIVSGRRFSGTAAGADRSRTQPGDAGGSDARAISAHAGAAAIALRDKGRSQIHQ